EILGSLVNLIITTRIALAIFKALKSALNQRVNRRSKRRIILSILSIVAFDLSSYILLACMILIPELHVLTLHFMFIATTSFAYHMFISLFLLNKLKEDLSRVERFGIEMRAQNTSERNFIVIPR
ncbi:hypothetical protein HK098_008217, partial [Nowakowskiella sp. JEL0407]